MRDIEKRISGIPIYIDKAVENWAATARRPYYRMRGKRITPEQAFEVIRRTDHYFSHGLELDDEWQEDYGWLEWNAEEGWGDMEGFVPLPECIRPLNFDMWWFNSEHVSGGWGWCRPDGVIGLNCTMQKYPNISELIEEWSKYVAAFPFFDLVIAITAMNEICQERWERTHELIQKHGVEKKLTDEAYREQVRALNMDDLEYQSFFEWVEAGVWIHDGVIEIMDKERTNQVYRQYESYEEADKRIYMPEFNKYFRPDMVTRDYLYRCIRAYGFDDPEALIRKKTVPYVT